MLNHPTVSKLHTLRLTGMAAALAEQSVQPDIDRLGFDERLGLLVDREATERDSRRLKLRLGQARLRQDRRPRGLAEMQREDEQTGEGWAIPAEIPVHRLRKIGSGVGEHDRIAVPYGGPDQARGT